MNFNEKNNSPFGCILDEEKQIDSYGVDHSGFSLRDELAYQIARTNQEEKLQKCFNNQGITKSYPQFGNSFWGGNSANNYGFGTCNIEDNVAQVQSRPLVPLTEVQKAKSRGFFGNLDGVAGEALEGLGKGVLSGAERAVNSGTLGAYEFANSTLFNGDYAKRQQDIRDLAEQANLVIPYNIANFAIDFGSGIYSGSKVPQYYDASKKGIQATKYFIDKMK